MRFESAVSCVVDVARMVDEDADITLEVVMVVVVIREVASTSQVETRTAPGMVV